jgi:hypothetical protein
MYTNLKSQKSKAMTKDEILELIFNEERELYEDYLYAQRVYGYEDASTKRFGAEWSAVCTLKDKIFDNEDN